MRLGLAIKKLRKERGMTQVQLSKLVGVSSVMVGFWEIGRTFPTQPKIKKVADAFGISVALLLLLAITDEDIPESKKDLYNALVNPLQKALMEESK
jgi:XRE family transcriptional regulator, regulator of sulfur utilization